MLMLDHFQVGVEGMLDHFQVGVEGLMDHFQVGVEGLMDHFQVGVEGIFQVRSLVEYIQVELDHFQVKRVEEHSDWCAEQSVRDLDKVVVILCLD